MKKKCKRRHFISRSYHYPLRVMKLVFTFLVLGFMTLSASTNAQKQIVDLELHDCTVIELFKAIQEKTDLLFFYNVKNFEHIEKMDVKAENEQVEDLLSRLFSRIAEFTYVDNIVIVKVKQDALSSSAQQREYRITGKVVDQKNRPLPGVTIRVAGTSIGTVSDKEGTFTLRLPIEKGELIFSFVGFQQKKQVFEADKEISVAMEEEIRSLDEVIVSTGYQQIDLRKTTSAIQSIKADDIIVPGLTSIDQMLEGYVPGMIFMQNSGQVGVTPRLRVRGTSTVLGNQEPLWVINGIVQENPVNVNIEQINDLDFVNLLGNAITGLNPDDIEQIDILKDASATALYGARAANGVIVVTTKQGQQGPPALSYSVSGTFRRRPYYSDASVNMMNSRDRVAFSRELIEKKVTYPLITEGWVGYEKALRDFWLGKTSYQEMQDEVSLYESVNTDWFDALMQNSFSHKHTLGLSGGNSGLRYYVSVGFDDSRGNIKKESVKQYTASVNLTANYNHFTIRFNLGGNTSKKIYTPSDVELTKYAYETTRALPLYNSDGSLWYYERQVTRENDGITIISRPFNIINDRDNTSQDIRSSGFNASVVVDYKASDYLKASLTASYAVNNTTQEVWHGENSLYANRLSYLISAAQGSYLPAGGELKYQNSEHYAYVVRGQVDFNKFMDKGARHLVNASVGGEVSSNQYYGLDQTYRGYLKDRGKKMAETVLTAGSLYTTWKGTNQAALGVWTDKLTNIASAYATLSYTFNNLYAINGNVRLDASNRFGSRANEKLAPIWSLSFRWDIKNDLLQHQNWLNDLSFRGSFGYQGNMLENQTAKLVLQRGALNALYQEYVSTIYQESYPNPNLRWEKTASYNASLDFSVLRNRISGSISYFYKKTQDAFLSKTVSSINGVDRYVVNQGTLENHGLELGLKMTLIDTRRTNPANGVRWSITPNIGQILNKLSGNSKDKALTNQITYQGLLDGTLEMEGRPLNSFYSYKYLGLNSDNGTPVFYGSQQPQNLGYGQLDFVEKYRNMEVIDIFTDVMTYSGTRVPTIQGGVQNSVSWRRFSLSMNLTYSFGSKIRLLQMYPNINNSMVSIAPQPTANVRNEFLNRWRKPGDEQYTDIPGIVSATDFTNTHGTRLWWNGQRNSKNEYYSFASSLWQMYDKSDLRTVSGNFVKIQSLSLRYNLLEQWCEMINIKSAYLGLSGTNLHTFCNKRLKGQDPATQDGTAPTINLSLRPTYSFNLSVTF